MLAHRQKILEKGEIVERKRNIRLENLKKKYQADHFDISFHAIEQFAKRWQESKNEKLTDPRRTLEKCLLQSCFQSLPPGRRVIRILSNNFVKAEYYRFGPWQFVIVEDDPKQKTVVTAAFVE